MAKGRKTGGRKVGSINKATRTVRERLSEVVDEYYNSKLFVEDLKELEPRERVTAMEKLANYAVPRMQSTTIDATIANKQTIEDKLSALAEGE